MQGHTKPSSSSETESIQRTLRMAASRCAKTAEKWSDDLTESDRSELVLAFHRAESLAHHALEQAIEQVSVRYRQELREQLLDEERHVDVFVSWHADCSEVVPPRSKQRGEAVWFVTLLLNEIAGYCQFEMLKRLLGSDAKQAQIAEIVEDEERHIRRLHGWLLPIWDTPTAKILDRMVTRFSGRLEGRMAQFFPREGLASLRNEMAEHIRDVVQHLCSRPGA